MKALVVIDMLKGFVGDRERKIIDNVKNLIDVCRRKGFPVIYVCDSHIPGDREFKLWGEHALRGTEDAEVVDELKPTNRDYVVYKRRYSGFFGTDLDLLLKELRVEEVILCGIYTEYCVKHTAADAFFNGYDVTIVRDCVLSYEDKMQELMLDYMAKAYGAKIVSLEQLSS